MSVDLQVLVSVFSGTAIAAILFRKVLWKGAKLAGRTILGGLWLALFAQFSAFTGGERGVKLLNALLLGVLGVPGFGLLCTLSRVTG